MRLIHHLSQKSKQFWDFCAELFLNTIIINEINRLLTRDHGGVVLSTGDVLDAAVTKVLQWFWQINFKQKCSVAQLTVLTPAERVHVLLWHSRHNETDYFD